MRANFSSVRDVADAGWFCLSIISDEIEYDDDEDALDLANRKGKAAGDLGGRATRRSKTTNYVSKTLVLVQASSSVAARRLTQICLML